MEKLINSSWTSLPCNECICRWFLNMENGDYDWPLSCVGKRVLWMGYGPRAHIKVVLLA